MASVKIVMRKDKKNSRNECPLYIRIIKHRKTSFVAVGLYLKEKDWDEAACIVKKSKKNSARLNAFLASKYSDAQGQIADVETKHKVVTTRILKQKIVGIEPVDFFQYCKQYLGSLEKGGHVGTYNRANAVIEKLKVYCDEKPLYLDDITHTFLQDYDDYLIADLENSPNTVHANMRMIKTILNRAINDGLISRDDNPFNMYKLRLVPTKRSYLTELQVQALLAVQLPAGSIIKASRDIFIFACFAGGIRISDLLQLRWNNISEGRVTVKAKKTGSTVVIKLTTTANEILNQYRTDEANSNGFIFPFVKDEEEIDSPIKLHGMISKKTALINKNLKIIAGRTWTRRSN